MNDISENVKNMLLKLYFYINPILMNCQECGIDANAPEIIEFIEYMNKYYPEEVKNVTINK